MANAGRPVGRRILPRIRGPVSLAWLKSLDRYQSLAVGVFEFSHDLPQRTDDSCHRQSEAVHAAPCVVGIADMMHVRIANRSATFNAVELRAVIGDENLVSALRCVEQQGTILLALPPEAVDVIDVVTNQEMAQRIQQLDRHILVEQNSHDEGPNYAAVGGLR